MKAVNLVAEYIIPELSIVAPNLFTPITEIREGARPGSWDAFKSDCSLLYSTDSRWCGGRFIAWTLKTYQGFGSHKRRGGYFDVETGVYFYGKGAR